MDLEKEIVGRLRVERFGQRYDPIIDTVSAYDLVDLIKYPEDVETKAICINNKIEIEEKIYLIKDISVDFHHPDRASREYNLTIVVYVEEVD